MSKLAKVILYVGDPCPWCKAFKPVFEKFQAAHPELKFETIDTSEDMTDAQIRAAKRYSIQTVPTTVFLTARGKLLTLVDGAVSLKVLEEELRVCRIKHDYWEGK